MKSRILVIGLIFISSVLALADDGNPNASLFSKNPNEPVFSILGVDGSKHELSIPASGLETQGVLLTNNSKKPIQVALVVDGVKQSLKIRDSGSVYLFAKGKFVHPFTFYSTKLSGTFRNISIGFSESEKSEPIMLSSITEGENEFLRIGPKDAKEKLLVEISNNTRNVELQKFEFAQ